MPDELTKIISTRLSTAEHDALLEECNKMGYSITGFLREACLEAMNLKPRVASESSATQKESSENQKIIAELQEKIIKLEADLAQANSTILKQYQTIEEFYKIVPQSELNRSKFGKAVEGLQ